MNSDRRNFIKAVVLGLVSTGPVISFLSCKNSDDKISSYEIKYPKGIEITKGYWVLEPETQKNMKALAVVLIPGIEKINVLGLFMEKMNNNHGDAGYYDAGLWNLNTISDLKYKKPFYQLNDSNEIKDVVNILSKSNRSFFNKFKREIITIYYSNPASWKKLAYNGPPQPAGFLDYHKKPAA